MKFDYDNAATREFALQELCSLWNPARTTENVSLDKAFGRVTAEEVTALHNLPVVRSSKRDGIAVRAADFAQGAPCTQGWRRGVNFAQADTGDDFPDDFDAVVARERFEFNEAGEPVFVDDLEPLKAGDGINPAGSIIKAGEMAVPAGWRLTPEYVAICAVGGAATIPVVRKPVVAFLPTGTELIPWGSEPARGQNIEANSLMVKGFVEEWGGECITYPVTPDRPESLERALDSALKVADIVLINGGSSRGEEDYNSQMLQRRASHFRHGVRTVPGRPVGMSIIDNHPVINVPGPVGAAFLCCDWLIRGLVAHFLGTYAPQRHTISARLTEDVKKPKPFERLARVTLQQSEDGTYTCTPLDVNGVARNIFGADAMASLPSGSALIEKGTPLCVSLLKPLESITHS